MSETLLPGIARITERGAADRDPDATAADATAIVETALSEGARLLHRPGRDGARDGRTRESARVITMVWGDRYLDDLLEITIPALLSPGNLPAFTEWFDCQFVIVTETRLFERIARSAAIAGVLRLADVRLVPIDDLLSPWYGITLTYALVRGYVDLGEAMTETHLVFLNADFIVADGSYRKLAEMIRRGERLVVSPSYCMNLEHTIDVLRRRRDPLSGALAMAPRELAALVLENRHNTIRAKTVNQQLFRIHRYDQYYWYVDERTLLCRQMPIAVIYMRPERVVTEMPTFWDYGVISEYCPTLTPCVLGDSDDFLMAELRSEGTFRELLHLGWPTVEEIAADLSSFTTYDHHVYGRHTLLLHSGDIPAGVEEGKRRLAEFVDSIYARLSPPIPYRDHPFWAPNFDLFTTRRKEAYRELQAREQAAARLTDENPQAAARQRRLAAVHADILATEGAIRAVHDRITEARQSFDAKLHVIEAELERQRAGIAAEAEPILRRHENELAALSRRMAALEAEAAELGQQQSDAIDQHRIAALEAEAAELSQQQSDAIDQHRIAALDEVAELDQRQSEAIAQHRMAALEAEAAEPDRRQSEAIDRHRMAALEAEAAEPGHRQSETADPDRAVAIEKQQVDPAEEPAIPLEVAKGPPPRAGKPTLPIAAPMETARPAAFRIGVQSRFVAWSARVYRKIFGTLPHTTPWHPYHAMLRPATTAIAVVADAKEALIVSSGGLLASGLLRGFKGRGLAITPGMLDSAFYQESLRGRGGFDLCLFDLAADDLAKFRIMLDKLRPMLDPCARIIVFHHNLALRSLDDWTFEFTRGLFPLIGRSQISFAGSYPGALAARWFARALVRHDVSRPAPILALAAILSVCGPLARFACWVEARRSPVRLPARCTGMTIEITLP